MHYEEKGFGIVELLIALMILSILGLVGWRVYESNRVSKTTSVPSTTAQRSTHKRIIALGDVICDPKDSHRASNDQNYCQDEKVLNLVKQLKPDAVLILGDIQYENGTLEKFQSTFSKNWGSLKNIIYPAPGNHEYGTPQASGYYTYFKDGPADVSKGYYSFALNNWHILSLNSNCGEANNCSQDSAQMKWLNEELGKNVAPCTLAFWHHPHFTSGKYLEDTDTKSRSTNMWTELSESKVDIVLNGHDHLYERFAKQNSAGQKAEDGIRQFTVGTGGKSHYKQKGSASNSEMIIDDQFGALVLDIEDDRYKWQFRNVDNQILDSGSQECNR